jgi:hypothetical protein
MQFGITEENSTQREVGAKVQHGGSFNLMISLYIFIYLFNYILIYIYSLGHEM